MITSLPTTTAYSSAVSFGRSSRSILCICRYTAQTIYTVPRFHPLPHIVTFSLPFLKPFVITATNNGEDAKEHQIDLDRLRFAIHVVERSRKNPMGSHYSLMANTTRGNACVYMCKLLTLEHTSASLIIAAFFKRYLYGF